MGFSVCIPSDQIGCILSYVIHIMPGNDKRKLAAIINQTAFSIVNETKP